MFNNIVYNVFIITKRPLRNQYKTGQKSIKTHIVLCHNKKKILEKPTAASLATNLPTNLTNHE